MKIQYFGHSCFLIETSKFSICLDPFSNIGLKEPNVSADYYFCSHNHYDHNNYSIVKGAKALDNKISFTLVDTFHDKNNGSLRGNNSILVLLEELKVVHLGDLGENLQDKDKLNLISNADILLCPIGGNYTINYAEAISLINKIKPKIVIPMHYSVLGSTVDIDTVDNFLNNANLSISRYKSKIDITSKDLQQKETKIYLLEVEN